MILQGIPCDCSQCIMNYIQLKEEKEERENRLDGLYKNPMRTTDILVEAVRTIDPTEYENLSKYQEWLRTVILMVENIPLPVSICSYTRFIEHPIIYVNKAFEEMTQYTREEVVGNDYRFLQGFVCTAEKATETEIKNTLLTQGEHKAILTNYQKYGEKFRNLSYLSPIKTAGGETRYYIWVQCNLTSDKTPYKYVLLVDDVMSIIPKVLDLPAPRKGDVEINSAVDNWLEREWSIVNQRIKEPEISRSAKSRIKAGRLLDVSACVIEDFQKSKVSFVLPKIKQEASPDCKCNLCGFTTTSYKRLNIHYFMQHPYKSPA